VRDSAVIEWLEFHGSWMSVELNSCLISSMYLLFDVKTCHGASSCAYGHQIWTTRPVVRVENLAGIKPEGNAQNSTLDYMVKPDCCCLSINN
jgi:hypothetical protein